MKNFFAANLERQIKPLPRYLYLYQKRTNFPASRTSETDRRRWDKLFSPAELRDLQVLFSLVFIDPIYREKDERVRFLWAQGGNFSEADKGTLRQVEQEIVARVIPEYKKFLEAGQIEISTSPLYHPILPLLVNPQLGRTANPHLPEYPLHFNWLADARGQLEGALADVQRLFGQRPHGVWPSEGSLSEEILDLLEELGLEWTAADEANLIRSLAVASGRGDRSDLLYQPYRWRAGRLRILFRDQHLSDLIGFQYQKHPAREAALDLHRRLTAIPVEKGALVSIILDGENAWEFFPANGRDFLREFYSLIEKDERIETLTFAQACRRPATALTSYQAGSWINGNFDIWIGDEENRRAWTLLRDAREAIGLERSRLSAELHQQLLELLYAAEGSDWYWWFGPEHISPDRETFDLLFRRNLQKIYHLLGRPLPAGLCQPLVGLIQGSAPALVPARGFIHPIVDGQISDYFEWADAGFIPLGASGGAMSMASRIATALYFGFSQEKFFLRLDTDPDGAAVLNGGYLLALHWKSPKTTRTVRFGPNGLADPPEDRSAGIQIGVGRIIEISIPLEILGVRAGDPLEFKLEWHSDGELLQSIPAQGTVNIQVPDSHHYAEFWQV